jgi:SPP1 gp7 family putative phage head morphogenesis protein
MELNKRNAEYWTERILKQEDSFYKDEELVRKELVKAYNTGKRELEKKLSSFLGKYQTDNNLDYQDMLKVMDKTQVADFKMSIAEYVKAIEETGSEELLKELNILTGRSRFQKIDELITDIKVQADILHTKQQEVIQAHLETIYAENCYKTAYEIQKGVGVAWSFGRISGTTIKTALDFPWSGENFSDRIWSNKDVLITNLRQDITQGLIQGKGYDDMVKSFTSRMDTSYYNAQRILATETSYVLGESHSSTFEEIGVEKYQIVAVLDKDTSDICRSQDGKIYNLKDRAVGVNAAPFHPHCRTTEIPYISDALNERVARFGKSKKVTKTDGNLTYENWYSNFVD